MLFEVLLLHEHMQLLLVIVSLTLHLKLISYVSGARPCWTSSSFHSCPCIWTSQSSMAWRLFSRIMGPGQIQKNVSTTDVWTTQLLTYICRLNDLSSLYYIFYLSNSIKWSTIWVITSISRSTTAFLSFCVLQIFFYILVVIRSNGDVVTPFFHAPFSPITYYIVWSFGLN